VPSDSEVFVTDVPDWIISGSGDLKSESVSSWIVYEVAPTTLLQLIDALEVVTEETTKPVGAAGAVENDHVEE